MENQNMKINESLELGEVVFEYSRDQAISDGILVPVGYAGSRRIVLTRGLFEKGYEDEGCRKDLIQKGLALLKVPDPEDTPLMRLRVMVPGKIWVIWHEGEGLTFLEPEDY